MKKKEKIKKSRTKIKTNVRNVREKSHVHLYLSISYFDIYLYQKKNKKFKNSLIFKKCSDTQQ